MNRYRTSGPLDDASINEGDTSLQGVNSYDSAENLQPGECAAATNMDFTSQDAKTRGGLVCLPELGAKPFGFYWNLHSSLAASPLGITYGNGTYVAVGNFVSSSTDGITWTDRVLPDARQYFAVTYGNGLFVAVGRGVSLDAIMTSPDGVTWTARVAPSTNLWMGVCWSGTQFVAVGQASTVLTSPDGITWTANTTGLGACYWTSVIYANGLYVAVGGFGTGHSIMTSPDAVTWTDRSATQGSLLSVVYGNSMFVAVGYNKIVTSSDGITWTFTTAPSSSDGWTAIAYNAGEFVAVSQYASVNAAMRSVNGTTWQIGVTPLTGFYSLTYGNGIFIAGSTSTGTYNYYPNAVLASGVYSDPNSVETPWIVLAGATKAGFYAFGQTSRAVAYPSGYVISKQSTVVQANNLLFIFSGSSQSPIQWDGSWGGAFVTCPVSTLGAGYENIPFSNQGTYYQNRLWVVNGKNSVDASQNLDFANFNLLTAAFNLNVGTSDYVLCSYPFGNNSLVVFKNRSSYLLQNVDGALTDVSSTEITRQIGIIGINAVTAAGPDIIYMSSDRNITSIRLNIQNDTQAVTVPLSRNINPIMRRVNWTYGYKVSMGYWNNLLFVALPLDQATVCNTIIVYNLITNQWYGEWTFDAALNLAVQGFVTANYLGQIRMHAITEDGRIFVVNEGQNDISGVTVAEISTSLTTRAYPANNENRFTRRLYLDLSTNRPNFSVTAYVEGASESTQELTNQTYSRSTSWLFSDTAYDLTNANDDYNRSFRQDYSSGPASVQCGTGFQPEMNQDFRLPLITRRNGRLQWLKITNTTGFISINGVGFESRDGYRSSLTQVG